MAVHHWRYTAEGILLGLDWSTAKILLDGLKMRLTPRIIAGLLVLEAEALRLFREKPKGVSAC